MQGHKEEINALHRRPEATVDLAIQYFNKLLRTLHFKKKVFDRNF